MGTILERCHTQGESLLVWAPVQRVLRHSLQDIKSPWAPAYYGQCCWHGANTEMREFLPCPALPGASLPFICSHTNRYIVLKKKIKRTNQKTQKTTKQTAWFGIHGVDRIIDFSIPWSLGENNIWKDIFRIKALEVLSVRLEIHMRENTVLREDGVLQLF